MVEASLFASFMVSIIGFALFRYGRKMERGPQVAVGLLMMVYPYFLSNVIAVVGVGCGLLIGLWLGVRYAGL